jgi:DNA-binding Lrp family transcriptional regulator
MAAPRRIHPTDGGSVMSAPIIEALRKLSQLKESLLHTAQELAHRASIYGVARVSYRYLARKCHCSVRTVIRHIQRLIELRIIRKTVLWIKGNFCEVNTYAFTIPWRKLPAQAGSSDRVTPKFPQPQEGEKTLSLGEEIRNLERGLHFLTPGECVYEATQERLGYLRGLLSKDTEKSSRE